MNLTAILASLLINSPVPCTDQAKPEVRFSGACENAAFEILTNETGYESTPKTGRIIFTKLGINLLEEEGRLASTECLMTSTLPAKVGYRISVSEFNAEADARILDSRGFASLFVNHRFNGEDLNGLTTIIRHTGKLVAGQKSAVGGKCGEEAVFNSKLTIKGKQAEIKFGSDSRDGVVLDYSYTPCEPEPKTENDFS